MSRIILLTVLLGTATVVFATDGAYLGISVTKPTAALRHHLKLKPDQGLVIASIQPNSPAAKAGFSRYDVLLELDGRATNSESRLIEIMQTLKPNQEVGCWVIRQGEHDAVQVTLGARPTAGIVEAPRHAFAAPIEIRIPEIRLDGTAQTNQNHAVRTMVFHDGNYAVDARQINGKLTISVRDREGKTVFAGDLSDPEDVEKLPKPVRERLRDTDMLAMPEKKAKD